MEGAASQAELRNNANRYRTGREQRCVGTNTFTSNTAEERQFMYNQLYIAHAEF
jgi:hypothetical protein